MFERGYDLRVGHRAARSESYEGGDVGLGTDGRVGGVDHGDPGVLADVHVL
jgi:hypothetical protein